MQNTSFAGSETAEAYLVDEAQYLQFGGESAAVVTHGEFATDHFVDEDEIVGYAGHQCFGRQSVETGKHVGAEAVVFQGFGFGIKGGQFFYETVCAEQSYHGGGSASHQFAHGDVGD